MWRYNNKLSQQKTNTTTYNSPLLKLEKEYNLTTTEYDGNIYLCEKPQADKETAVAVENLEKLNMDQTDMNFTLEHLTQRDMPLPESLSMDTTKNDNPVNFFDIDLTSPIQHATPTVGATIKAINTILEKRHHILTLEYTMRKESTRTPIFLNTNIDFRPFYGSNEAKDFFVGKLKSIRQESDQCIMEKLTASCKEFTTKCTFDADKLKLDLYKELNSGSESGNKAITEFNDELLKLKNKWTEEYRTSVNRMNSTSGNTTKFNRDRNRPYYNRHESTGKLCI
ncbi:unnamed protein product [Mytilus coruscus]|uniref:Uncharacterized protein n=1 Tax=Mytilus coruscus TaxID=42192 RepID=A0A6J8A7F5_MYTCO|nr:unnamed protein product [Mytilus coruscus]